MTRQRKTKNNPVGCTVLALVVFGSLAALGSCVHPAPPPPPPPVMPQQPTYTPMPLYTPLPQPPPPEQPPSSTGTYNAPNIPNPDLPGHKPHLHHHWHW